MLYEQKMLDKIERQVARLKRQMRSLDEDVAAHDTAASHDDDAARRAAGEGALLGAHERGGQRARWAKVNAVALHQAEESEQVIMAQIERAWNQTDALWAEVGECGTFLAHLNRRVDDLSSLAQASAGSQEVGGSNPGGHSDVSLVAHAPAASRHGSSRVVGRDISPEVAKALKVYIAGIHQNVTLLEWKIYYMKLDLESTNGTFWHIANRSVGVNGTDVDWTAHDARWIPTFSEEGEEEEPATASLMERSSSGRLNRASNPLEGVPPLAKECQEYITHDQSLLDKIELRVARLERGMTSLDNYMAHRGQVFVQENTDSAHGKEGAGRAAGKPKDSSGRKRAHITEGGLHHPEQARQLLMEQIEAEWNQTDVIWAKVAGLGADLQQLKRRVGVPSSLA